MSLTSTEMRLKALRKKMAESNIDLYMVTNEDHHLNYFPPEYFHQLKYLTGCPVKDGVLLVTQENAHFWTVDSFGAAAREALKDTEIVVHIKDNPDDEISNLTDFFRAFSAATMQEIINGDISTSIDWEEGELDVKAEKKTLIGFDGRCFSFAFLDGIIREMETPYQMGAVNISPTIDLVGEIWKDRGELRPGNVYLYPELPDEDKSMIRHSDRLEERENLNSIAGRLSLIRKKMMGVAPEAGLPVIDLDDISWIFGIGGEGGDYGRLPLAYAYITMNEARLYLPQGRFSGKTRSKLEEAEVEICDYGQFYQSMENIREERVIIDPEACNASLALNFLFESEVGVISGANLISGERAVLSPEQMGGARKAALLDSIVMCQLMKWMDEGSGKEISLEKVKEKINQFRDPETFVSESRPVELEKYGNSVMVRFGSNYINGTSTLARTMALGKPDPGLVYFNTVAVKAFMNVDASIFPKGILDSQFDCIFRKSFWNAMFDYEGPSGWNIGSRTAAASGPLWLDWSNPDGGTEIKCNMAVALCPHWGDITLESCYIFRSANKIAESVAPDRSKYIPKGMIISEATTLAPFDPRLIDFKMLSYREVMELKDYNDSIIDIFSQLEDEDMVKWLKKRFEIRIR